MKTLLEKNIDLSLFKPYNIACNSCCGLCCVVLFFSKMDGFPEDKAAGRACKNLQQDFKCSIYSKLFSQGLKGCMAYDCFGAGQLITKRMTSMPDWQSIPPKEAGILFKSYLTVMQINQVLWYLTEASVLCLSHHEKAQVNEKIEEGKALTEQPLEILQALNADLFREQSNKILRHISFDIKCRLLTNHSVAKQTKNYIGANLRQKNLTGMDFTMSLLIAANLEKANLYGANFLGADMRDTNIKDTDLSQSLFLTQIQINAAKGNQNTILPAYLCTPELWK